MATVVASGSIFSQERLGNGGVLVAEKIDRFLTVFLLRNDRNYRRLFELQQRTSLFGKTIELTAGFLVIFLF